MSERPAQDPPPPPPDAEPAGPDDAVNRTAGRKRGSFFGGLVRHLRHAGREMVSVAVGKYLAEPPDSPEPPATTEPGDQAGLHKRVHVLHEVTEKLRGAADTYIAAKLDEMEARVDAKLDHIEQRIDHKLIELHKQMAEMRDRELRHRLRLLKITLIFTVLVALLSLGYKWLSRLWN